MDTNAERPYWFPQLTDAAWVARIRSDYPEDTEGMSDEDVVEQYADGSKYATLWDHVGDAYTDYEPLADAYLALTAERDTLKALCVEHEAEIERVSTLLEESEHNWRAEVQNAATAEAARDSFRALCVELVEALEDAESMAGFHYTREGCLPCKNSLKLYSDRLTRARSILK